MVKIMLLTYVLDRGTVDGLSRCARSGEGDILNRAIDSEK